MGVELVLTSRILRLCELHEGPQSETAHHCDHKADAEHRHDLQLLLVRHVKLRQHGQRQGEDDKIKEDLDCTPYEAKKTDIHTAEPGHLATPPIPEEGDRGALEYHGEDVADAEAGDNTDESPHKHAHPFLYHNAKVEGEDGQLTQALGEHVHEVGNIEPLQALGNVVRPDAPNIPTESETSGYDHRDVHTEGGELESVSCIR